MYCQVFFTQDTEILEEIEDILYDDGGWATVESIHAAAEYMSGWDYGGENEHDDAVFDEIEEEDNIYSDQYFDEETEYTIVIQRGLYASLWRETKYY